MVGRARRKSRLIALVDDQALGAEERRRARSTWSACAALVTPRATPMTCQMRLKSPRWLAVGEHRVGDRVAARRLELRRRPTCRIVRRPGRAALTRSSCRRTRRRCANARGASTAASSGSPPNAGHHCWNEHDRCTACPARPEIAGVHARSTAFHTAVVRVVMNLTDCADGTASIVSPELQVHQPDRGRALAEHGLAQERVEVHAGEALLLVVARRGAAGLVVGDDQLTVGVELEPVDDAAQRQFADLGLQPQLEPDLADRAWGLPSEVLARSASRRRAERLAPSASRRASVKSGSVRYSAAACIERRPSRVGGAIGGGAARTATPGPGARAPFVVCEAGWLGQLLDAGEPELHRARRERLDPAGRQAGRHREHVRIVEHGCAQVTTSRAGLVSAAA